MRPPAASQSAYPWRAVIRTIVEAVLALAAAAPLIYYAITEQDATAATGAAATFLGVAAAITRIAALPVVEDFLHRFGLTRWLAAQPPQQVQPFASTDGFYSDDHPHTWLERIFPSMCQECRRQRRN